MTEETSAAAEAATNEKQNAPAFALQRLYLKDMSFETPQGVKAFQKQWKPQVSQDLNTKTTKIDDSTYEVALRITVTVKDEEDAIYLIEVEQAGLFTVVGLQDAQLAQVLNTACPNILFPYAREVIDNTLTKGSFPPLMLPPINFDALFAAAVKQAQERAAAGADAEGAATH